ncbi:hypothetical protein ANO11243_094000 [Dothideomycetidae sp. 11243]|nr:hypothetical protein ANO11243_094000 [fungal sp. No.11243]
MLWSWHEDFSGILARVREHDRRYPDFGLPRSQQRIYYLGMTAANQLGDRETESYFAEKRQKWARKCPWAGKYSAFSDKAVLDHQAALHYLVALEDDTSFARTAKAVQLLFRVASYEFEQGVLTASQLAMLFPQIGEIPTEAVAEYLRQTIEIDRLTSAIIGTVDLPTLHAAFLVQYQKWLDWATLPNKLPSLEVRSLALQMILQGRLDLCSEHMIRSKRNHEIELAKMRELKTMRSEWDSFLDLRALTVSEVHATLLNCFPTSNGTQPRIPTEEELEAQVENCKTVVRSFNVNGKILDEYHSRMQMIGLMYARQSYYERVLFEEILACAEEQEVTYRKIKKRILLEDPAGALVAKAKSHQDFLYREHYDYAISTNFRAFNERKKQYNDNPSFEAQRDIVSLHGTFLEWCFRSKGRGFRDILNLEIGVARELRTANNMVIRSHEVPRLQDSPREDWTVLEDVHRPPEDMSMRSDTAESFLQGDSVTSGDVQSMLKTLPENVVIIDFVDARYRPRPGLISVVHRRDQSAAIIPLNPMTSTLVEAWVKENINSPHEGSINPLSGPDAAEKLAHLSGLLAAIQWCGIQPGATIIICPSGSLNQVPIHAVPFEGRPLIERNPVVYCQSLTVLYWLWQKVHKISPPPEKPKSFVLRIKAILDGLLRKFFGGKFPVNEPKFVVLNPMHQKWPKKNPGDADIPVKSIGPVKRIGELLGGIFIHGFEGEGISKTVASDAIKDASLLHYHGHVEYNPGSALDSIMILNRTALNDPWKPLEQGYQALSARDLFKIKMHEPAMAVIIGCGSGMSNVTTMDDVIGFPTALFYAGASAVVSTMWPLDDQDGADFATRFYAALTDLRSGSRPTGREDGLHWLSDTVDVARAMQTAVLNMYNDAARVDRAAPYHWAPFTLNGFWMVPGYVIPRGSCGNEVR